MAASLLEDSVQLAAWMKPAIDVAGKAKDKKNKPRSGDAQRSRR